jgi:peptide deformylase
VKGFSVGVARYPVLGTGMVTEGKPISWQTSGWPARIFQHEMDHLRCRLYTDIMVRSSFTCTCWEKVNRTGGRIYVPFSPK